MISFAIWPYRCYSSETQDAEKFHLGENHHFKELAFFLSSVGYY